MNKTRGGHTHIIWLGDFNRHHPQWDKLRNAHLFTQENLDKAQTLIEHTDNLDLYMILPRYTPTLKAMNTGNYTRPDNVFTTQSIADNLISCKTVEGEIPP